MAVQNKSSTKDLGTLLQGVFKQKNWQNRIGIHQVFLFWDKLVGELANRAQPDIIRGDTLWVSVSDSVWMQQLQFEKQTLLDQINSKLKAQHTKHIGKDKRDVPQISDIKFKLAPIHSVTSEITTHIEPKLHSLPIDTSRYKEFDATANSINDETIEKSIKNLWLALERRKKIQT